MDFFQWGHLRSIIYETPVTWDVDLVSWLAIAAPDVQDMVAIYANVRRFMRQRYEARIIIGGRSFERLLWHVDLEKGL